MTEKLLTQAEVADLLQIKPRTLETWRLAGKGPRMQRVGHLVRYRPSDVVRWLDEQRESVD